MKLYKAKCSQCGRTFRRSTRTELLSALRKHMWANHPAWMRSRIKTGKAKADKENPSIQDLIRAVQTGVRAGIPVARLMSKGRYQQVKQVMDAVSPVLPPKVQATWRAIEATHDAFETVRGAFHRRKR